MSTVDTYPRHYSYPLVTWGATLLGGVVAVVTSVMLNLLGAAVGIATATAARSSNVTEGAGIGGLIWLVVANLIALGFGAWVAGRSTANPDHHGGTLQGVAVWAVTSLAVLVITGWALAGLGGALMQTAGIAATASNATIAHQADRTDASARAQAAMQNAQASMLQNQAAMQHSATQAAEATAAGSFGTFLTMLLGMGATILGARMGARHPGWADRPRYTYVERTQPRALKHPLNSTPGDKRCRKTRPKERSRKAWGMSRTPQAGWSGMEAHRPRGR